MTEAQKVSPVGCIIELLALPLRVLLRGYVLRSLWGWFVVPLGLSPIGLLEAVGLGLTVSFLTYRFVVSPFKDEPHPWLTRILASVLISLTTWGVGWVVAVGLA